MFNLAQLFKIQKTLKKANYSDYQRIAKEISAYAKDGKKLTKILAQIEKGKPWEYIHGQANFYTLTFKINRGVLIPRIETEKLVSLAIAEYKKNKFDIVIDVGTGSACIIISLINSLQLPSIFKGDISNTKFLATDSSQKALNVATSNIKKYKLKKLITLTKNNLIKNITVKDKSVLILANLPYIPTEQYRKLDASVKNFEPRSALDGGKDGNKYYKELFKQMSGRKWKNFTLILETESRIIKDTQEIFKKYKTTIVKDIKNKKRFVIVRG
ncbi:peptide chain release factor N(5)-glutamine methyltransferase [bacterium]|nr:peptide chain release factor N(5)-glutamine methyltransferase [bacterium]